ncbi:MAG: sigma-70 family RNA polymerase sigma factor [Lachnospiraceae bacterium]|nr:sigma-70 family RNA polymerase sigma factor [Lachnospiraceae bacterium]
MHQKKAALKFIETCYQLYEQKMYQIAYGILRDVQLAEDAVQNAFLKLMRHNIYFEDANSDDTKRYMITIIKHSAIDIYQHKKREQEFLYLSDQVIDRTDHTDQDKQTEYAELNELISQLPPRYLTVVQCLVNKKLSVKETALELGITEVNVRKRFERAKKMLQIIVKGSDLYETGS